jgi:hypothetical protein
MKNRAREKTLNLLIEEEEFKAEDMYVSRKYV